MRDIVVGMAGHIDHGKTTVVKYLTGVDTDTLPEEKARGMTINLGFTQIKFSDGSKVGLVDVPGHEKFIKNMSAGASGVDFLLLVIACDDGIMPQTVEHFQIVKLFGVKKGMILLTKCDLVTSERVEEVKKQCLNFFKGSFLEEATVCKLSLKDPQSYDLAKEMLFQELKKLPLSKSKKFFRMDIDRVFSVKGFGCVVTGTIKSGNVCIGDSLKIYPQEKIVKVKGIESHGEKKENLNSGNRCAINISGVEVDELSRGDTIAASLLGGDRIDCFLTLLEAAPKLKTNHRIRLNIGTTELIGRVRFYDRNYLLGGEGAIVQLQLENPIYTSLGDRGIVRNYSPVVTLGGIEVIYIPKEEFNRKNPQQFEFLTSLYLADKEKKIELLLKKGLNEESIASFLGTKPDIEPLISQNRVFRLDKNIFHKEILDSLLSNSINFLVKFHEENSLKKGIVKPQFKTLFFETFTQKEFNNFLNLDFVKERIKLESEYISLKEFKIKLTKKEKNFKEEIFSTYKRQGFNLVKYSSLFPKLKEQPLFEKVHNYMVEDNFLLYLENETYILRGFLEESIKRIEQFFQNKSELSVKETRELLNNDRDSAILILRKLDNLEVTENRDGLRLRRKV